MLIGGDDIGNDVITLDACFHVFFNTCLASCAFLLCTYLQALLPFSALLPQCDLERLLARYFKCSWEKCIISMALEHKNFTYMQSLGGKSNVFCGNSKNNS